MTGYVGAGYNHGLVRKPPQVKPTMRECHEFRMAKNCLRHIIELMERIEEPKTTNRAARVQGETAMHIRKQTEELIWIIERWETTKE